MTLKEKFEQILIAFWTSEWEGQCEQVADEFAIGFAEWCLDENHIILNDGKELLEIYKKENNL